MRPSMVEQVFVERRGGVTLVLLVLEDAAGGRTRERIPLPVTDPAVAVRQAARQLAHRGIGPARRVRLRAGKGDSLVDDARLRELFLAELDGSSGNS